MKLRVVLFALTGFGNKVLEALLKDTRVEVVGVFTVKYDQPFPYYHEIQLLDYCQAHQITCFHDIKVSGEEGMKLLEKLSPDLILVATFKQILKQNVIDLPPLGVVNFHPSLLPRYRGACPSNAVLFNGDRFSGVTAHYVTQGMDDGDVLLQREIDISEIENDGILRHRLAILAGEMVPDLVKLFDGGEKPHGAAQDHSLASFAPKPKIEQGYIELAPDVITIQRMIKAYNPIPGTSILVGDRRIPIGRYQPIYCNKSDGIYEQDQYIDLVKDSRAIRLFKNNG